MMMSRCEHTKLSIRSDNNSLPATNNLVTGRLLSAVKLQRCSILKGEVATDKYVDRSV